MNFIEKVIIEIFVPFSIKTVNPFKSFINRKSKTKPAIWSGAKIG
jgi:hypothetical protein